jgi:hypothetical protein
MIPGLPANFLSDTVGPITGRSWERLVQSALTENDPDKLLGYIHATEIAMFLQWQELGIRIDAEEHAAMQAAADTLLAIKMHKLGWPDFRR